MKLKMNFKSLKILKRIITNESFYQIQLFTLESFDLFENWLINNNILYTIKIKFSLKKIKK